MSTLEKQSSFFVLDMTLGWRPTQLFKGLTYREETDISKRNNAIYQGEISVRPIKTQEKQLLAMG